MTELTHYSATQLLNSLRDGSVSIADALDALRQRMEVVDGVINALPTHCFDKAYERAGQLQSLPVEDRGVLCGMPVTIKDLTPVAGVRTTFGSKLFENHIPPVSDQLVQRIEQRGGVVYAKSNTPEFGAGGITFNDVLGKTRSPHNIACASGGSSGGAAASLASGTAWLSHGSDMAGSLRTPASFCGVCSLRPSPGTIRSDSEFLPYQVLGAEGPMARTIADLALFADAMRCDNDHSMQAALASKNSRSLSDYKVAFSSDLGITSVSHDVSEAFEHFKVSLSRQVAHCKDAHPDLTNVHDAFDVLRANIFAIGLESALKANPNVMKPEVIWNVRQGLELDSSQIRQAMRQQGKLVNTAAKFMQNIDVLICPAVSVMSVPADERYPGADSGVPIPEYYRWLAIAYATTMTTLPIITLPINHQPDGMPFAIQLVGKPWGEAALLQVANAIESMVEFKTTPVSPMDD